MTFQKSDINRRGGGSNSKNNNIPIISEVDEENEETIMEKAKINSGRGSTTTNSLSKPKSVADNWKGIGNRHMASQVSSTTNFHAIYFSSLKQFSQQLFCFT